MSTPTPTMTTTNAPSVSIADRLLGPGQPVYIVGEIGLNHNGDVAIAKKLIDVAKLAGCDAVKFQKRTPELCVPPEQRDVQRETPWGIMSYLNYRRRVEFGEDQYAEIDAYCRQVGIDWFASCWDEPSVDFIERFNPVCHKIASASLTDEALVRRINATGRPVILSTGMSTPEQIEQAVSWLDKSRLLLCHTTSTYPAKPQELNLRCIEWLAKQFGCPVGYSGHEVGLQVTYAAVALGACFVERHITLDRAMWGSDQAASVEPSGLIRLVRDIRVIEQSLGDGKKQVYASEKPVMAKLRRTQAVDPVQRDQQAAIDRNRVLKDRHKGERCFILATGPSIKQQPLHLLAGERCMSVSNFFVHPDFKTIAPAYHCVAAYHPPLTEENWQGWMDEMAAATEGTSSLFFAWRDRDRNTRGGRFANHGVHYLSFGAQLEQMTAQGIDLTRPLPWPQSVTIQALAAAVYMGFDEVYLLGCDHDWILHVNHSTHFYDEQQHALNRGGYNEWYGSGLDNYMKAYVRLWSQYRAVKDVADQRNIKIYNATAGGMLDVFPRVRFEDVVAPAKIRVAA